MRRTQLYLDDNLWNALHTRARSRKTSISELVREAVRERYLGSRDQRMKAMQELVGVRKGTADSARHKEPAFQQEVDAVEYVQTLRRSGRLDRLHQARKA